MMIDLPELVNGYYPQIQKYGSTAKEILGSSTSFPDTTFRIVTDEEYKGKAKHKLFYVCNGKIYQCRYRHGKTSVGKSCLPAQTIKFDAWYTITTVKKEGNK